MLTILAFIVTLGILVTVHEYGHFQAAKWCGVKVLKFSIGFGKPLWRKKIGPDETEFVIAAIPLGGYVKMLGEEISSDNIEPATQDMSRALNQQSVFKRMAIVLAGPFANLLLAIVLYWLLFMQGVVGIKPIVGNVLESSPAAVAGIGTGELIQKIDGKEVATWQDVRWVLLNESLKKNSVEIQSISQQQETQRHQLDVSGINYDEADQDILEKLGMTMFRPSMPAYIGEIVKGGPADLANLKASDLVVAVNNKKISDWEDFVQQVRLHPNVALDVLVLRGADQMHFTVTPESVLENNKTVGRIGAASKIEQSKLDQLLITTHFTAAESLVKAVEKTWDNSVFSLKMLGNMLLGKVSWKGMSGPVTIASYAGQSAQMGIKVFLGFLALISISIGILNLLPIPVLDGGHFMYYMVELLTGKPVSEAAVSVGQRLGILILGCMMILALYNDMNRLITG